MDLVPSLTTLAYVLMVLSIAAIAFSFGRKRNGANVYLAVAFGFGHKRNVVYRNLRKMGIAGIAGAVILLAIGNVGFLPVLAFASLLIGVGLAVWYGAVMLKRQSLDEKARRLADKGKLADALRLYADRENGEGAVTLLKERLPKWTVSRVLIEVVGQLFVLQSNVAGARSVGVPQQVTDRLSAEADAVMEKLWSRAERIVVVAGYKVDSEGLQQAIDRETTRMNALNASIHDARSGLALLTYGGNASHEAIAMVEVRFQSLADTARALEEEGLG
mgnify:CR=1 FL=1